MLCIFTCIYTLYNFNVLCILLATVDNSSLLKACIAISDWTIKSIKLNAQCSIAGICKDALLHDAFLFNVTTLILQARLVRKHIAYT